MLCMPPATAQRGCCRLTRPTARKQSFRVNYKSARSEALVKFSSSMPAEGPMQADWPLPRPDAVDADALGARVLETLHPSSLLQDTIAVGMLGPAAAADVLRKAHGASASTAAGNKAARRECGGAALRAHWADQQLLTALQQHQQQQQQQGLGPAKDSTTISGGWGGTELPMLQVVVLGAAIDTRPWRLALPPGVAWFDCDHPTALAVKHRQLEQLGVPAWAPATLTTSSAAASSQHRQLPWVAWALSCVKQLVWMVQLQQAALVARWKRDAALQQATNYLRTKVVPQLPLLHGGMLHQHPTAHTVIPVDLTRPASILQQLSAAGFKRGHPTVWVAEDLVYFLEPSAAKELFQDLAAASGPGSHFIFTALNEAVGAWLRTMGPSLCGSSSALMIWPHIWRKPAVGRCRCRPPTWLRRTWRR